MENQLDISNLTPSQVEWLDLHTGVGTFSTIPNGILRLRPDLHFFLTVEGLDISSQIFPTEFHIIAEAYIQVLEKMRQYRQAKLKLDLKKLDKFKNTSNTITIPFAENIPNGIISIPSTKTYTVFNKPDGTIYSCIRKNADNKISEPTDTLPKTLKKE
jgi:hypothetical protein